MPSIYCGTHFTIFIYCCRSFPSLFLQKSQVPFFLPFSLSLISLSPIAISPFSVPSFHFFILFVFLHFFTSKAVIFYTKTVIFISDSMTTVSYLRSSPGLHFYIVILVEEHTKAVIFISKLCECRFVFFVTPDNTKSASIACREGGRADYNCCFYLKNPRRRWKKTLKL
ncbi:hypothetical protein JHK87_033447 [Glycine soja]|nr:hypothetical protein JHK87_033447 [Glycine soja]